MIRRIILITIRPRITGTTDATGSCANQSMTASGVTECSIRRTVLLEWSSVILDCIRVRHPILIGRVLYLEHDASQASLEHRLPNTEPRDDLHLLISPPQPLLYIRDFRWHLHAEEFGATLRLNCPAKCRRERVHCALSHEKPGDLEVAAAAHHVFDFRLGLVITYH